MKTNITLFVVFIMSMIGCYLMLTGSVQASVMVAMGMLVFVALMIIFTCVQSLFQKGF